MLAVFGMPLQVTVHSLKVDPWAGVLITCGHAKVERNRGYRTQTSPHSNQPRINLNLNFLIEGQRDSSSQLQVSLKLRLDGNNS